MLEKLEGLVKEVCTKHGVGLYDLELIKTQQGKVLCIYITKVNGVSISDCTSVSKEVSVILDSDDSLLAGPFTLEVSSPGLERPLKLKKHYMSAINEDVKISYQTEEKKDTIVGKLAEVDLDYIKIITKEDSYLIPFHSIKKAKTFYQIRKKETV